MENFKLIEEKENPLFNRKEIRFEVKAEITPSRTEILKLISEKFSTQIENIKIKKIHGRFGSNNFNITTFIYKSKEDKNKLEIKKKKEKLAETPKEKEPNEALKTSSENNKTEDKVEESKEDSSKNEEQKEVDSKN